MLAILTLGLALLFIPRCQGCGHAMSLHHASSGAAAGPAVVTPPPVPPGMPAPVWNGTVWQAWNPQGNRWMVWSGHGWQ